MNPSFQDYHPPFSKDIPIDFRVTLLKDAPNPLGILGSKGKKEKSLYNCLEMYPVTSFYQLYNGRI